MKSEIKNIKSVIKNHWIAMKQNCGIFSMWENESVNLKLDT